MRRFVADFADLTREAKDSDFLPIELNAFAESVRTAAQRYAAEAGVRLEVQPAPFARLGARGPLPARACGAEPGAERRSRRRRPVDPFDCGSKAGAAALPSPSRIRGAGIAPERIPELFDSFSSTKRTGAHLGMGLPNVRRIVDGARRLGLGEEHARARAASSCSALPGTKRSSVLVDRRRPPRCRRP